MIKRIVLIVLFFILGLAEISFIKVLPAPLNIIPALILPGIFLIQQKKQRLGAFWIIGAGLFYDFLYPVSTTSPEIAKHAVLAVVLIAAFRYFFSTQSFYSLIGGGLLAAVFLSVYDLAYFSLVAFWTHTSVSGPLIDELISLPWTILYFLAGLTVILFADSRLSPFYRSI